jgi:hypothetical protein
MRSRRGDTPHSVLHCAIDPKRTGRPPARPGARRAPSPGRHRPPHCKHWPNSSAVPASLSSALCDRLRLAARNALSGRKNRSGRARPQRRARGRSRAVTGREGSFLWAEGRPVVETAGTAAPGASGTDRLTLPASPAMRGRMSPSSTLGRLDLVVPRVPPDASGDVAYARNTATQTQLGVWDRSEQNRTDQAPDTARIAF